MSANERREDPGHFSGLSSGDSIIPAAVFAVIGGVIGYKKGHHDGDAAILALQPVLLGIILGFTSGFVFNISLIIARFGEFIRSARRRTTTDNLGVVNPEKAAVPFDVARSNLRLFAAVVYGFIIAASILNPAACLSFLAFLCVLGCLLTMGRSFVFIIVTMFVISMLGPVGFKIAAPIFLFAYVVRVLSALANWRPIYVGMASYAVPCMVALRPILTRMFGGITSSFVADPETDGVAITFAIFFGATAALVFHHVIRTVERTGYTTREALHFVTATPFILFGIAAPIVAAHASSGNAHHGHSLDQAHPQAMHVDHSAPPSVEQVHSHWRSLPDGIETNNLSYHGPDADPTSAPGYVHIDGYLRTPPDHDPTNNLRT